MLSDVIGRTITLFDVCTTTMVAVQSVRAALGGDRLQDAFITLFINEHTQRIAGTISVCRNADVVLSALEN
eukprot:793521-Pleurochrysis_carterae.AAC.1